MHAPGVDMASTSPISRRRHRHLDANEGLVGLDPGRGSGNDPIVRRAIASCAYAASKTWPAANLMDGAEAPTAPLKQAESR